MKKLRVNNGKHEDLSWWRDGYVLLQIGAIIMVATVLFLEIAKRF